MPNISIYKLGYKLDIVFSICILNGLLLTSKCLSNLSGGKVKKSYKLLFRRIRVVISNIFSNYKLAKLLKPRLSSTKIFNFGKNVGMLIMF